MVSWHPELTEKAMGSGLCIGWFELGERVLTSELVSVSGNGPAPSEAALQGQRGPKMSGHQNTENKRSQLIQGNPETEEGSPGSCGND